ncbi:MAG: DUF2007 domain-containing protein [Phycisphaerales bacterium]|nr:DUF2007 domain-containing protein [Phycisphaerales bacterium]MCB9836643.1 DUF2007 domain-containing protein [Phycisphaera sp.]
MASPQDLVPVTDASGPAEAHIVASMLRESGVEAFVFDTANQTLQWDAPRIINPYLIHVKHEDLDRARQLIKSNREESVDLDWDEVDVGEPVDEIAEQTARHQTSDQQAGYFWPISWKNLHRWFFLGILIYLAVMLILNIVAYVARIS